MNQNDTRRLDELMKRDRSETTEHAIRVSKWSRKIAKELGKDEAWQNQIEEAARYHDIGKCLIPSSVLYKEGLFTDEERHLMREHPNLGGNFIKNVTRGKNPMIECVARTHHEKWDGSGYPNGLKGEQIPFEGRVVAVADVFDALTSIRSYKKSWSVEEAIQQIKKESGTAFDPIIVEAFLRAYEKNN